MTRSIPRLLGYTTVGAGVTAAGYVGLVTGACPLDLGIGRRVRPLGPQLVDMAAPREVVFDVIAEPYLGRAPRALADKLRVLDRGGDMVLAAHFTPLGGRLGLVAQTVETVRFTPGPSGSTSGWSAGRFPTSWRHSCSASRPVGPGPGWPTTGRSGPTCGGRDSAGVSWSRAAGSRRWRPRWLRSRPKPNGARRVSWHAGAPAPTNRPQPQADSPPPSRSRPSATGHAPLAYTWDWSLKRYLGGSELAWARPRSTQRHRSSSSA
jgi:hypothetical protein